MAYHEACHAEVNRRLRAGNCTRCGGRPAAPNARRCAECGAMDDPPFLDYPPTERGLPWLGRAPDGV